MWYGFEIKLFKHSTTTETVVAQSCRCSFASLHHKCTIEVSHRANSFCFMWLHSKSSYYNSCEKWKSRWKWKVYQISTYHSINWKQLVPPFEPSMPFCHSSRNDARNINRWILFLSSHDIKAQAFISLWQLHHSWVWMAFTCSKSSNCCLEEKKRVIWLCGENTDIHSVVHLQEEFTPVKTF